MQQGTHRSPVLGCDLLQLTHCARIQQASADLPFRLSPMGPSSPALQMVQQRDQAFCWIPALLLCRWCSKGVGLSAVQGIDWPQLPSRVQLLTLGNPLCPPALCMSYANHHKQASLHKG